MQALTKVLGGVCVAAAIAASGCGSSDSTATGGSSSSASSTPSTTGASSTQPVSAFEARTAALFKMDSFTEPEAGAPKPKPGAKVWAIPFGLGATAGAEFADGVKTAGRKIGWEVKVFDGKFDPNNYLTGIRQALASKADGIILYAIDCPTVQSALGQAKAAKIPVIGVESFDCNELEAGAPKLFSSGIGLYNAEPFGHGSQPYEQWIQDNGRAPTSAMVAYTKGKAKVIDFVETDTRATLLIDQGFKQELARCPDCQIVETVKYTARDIGTSLQSKAAQALLRHPEANAVFGNYDTPITGGIATAVLGSGRNDKLYVTGGEGDPPNVDLVRSNGGQDLGVTDPVRWEGFAGVDALNRAFNGMKPGRNGIGMALWDAQHNLPPKGKGVVYPVDYEGAYYKAWGVG
jgi:ribose transport system substrate-binding protein